MAIPDATLRHDALRAIDHKRANIDGAVLFWTLPQQRESRLLQILVAYEVLADFLDCTSERGARAGIANGVRLHQALCDALDEDSQIGDYYQYHPWNRDGGFLHRLIEVCQKTCVHLPSFPVVRPFIERAASLTEVLAFNHEPDPVLRDDALSTWAEAQLGKASLTWFEWCGGASAWLTIYALLALATDYGLSAEEAKKTYCAYLPWVSLVGTMLDSYVDWDEDQTEGTHSYIAHYPSKYIAAERIAVILDRALREVSDLNHRHRHLVIVGCMVAMYLSKCSARTSTAQSGAIKVVRAGGPLIYPLIPALRMWRTAYRQRSD